MTKINHFVYKIRESSTVPKQELAYNLRSLDKVQKLPIYSDQGVDRSEKQGCLKTLICIECIGKNTIWIQLQATLQF